MNYINIFSSVKDFIEMFITSGGYAILFLSTILEGVPLVGMVIPGHITIVIGGFLARLGSLNLFWVLCFSILGALLGDYIGFAIGKKYGISFIAKIRPYFFITDEHILKAQTLLQTHTGKALIIGRFTPATRALMPFLVGTTSASIERFWFYNIIGGISWVTLSVLAGYIFGTAYHAFSHYLGKALIIAILATFLFVWGYKFINSRFHIFKKYELFTLILNILSLLAFAMTVDKLVDSSFKLNFDIWINLVVENYTKIHHYLINIAELISNFGSVYSIAITGSIIGIYLAFKKKWRSATIMILSISLTGFVSGLLKIIFMSPRPSTILIDPSFPSSHSAMAATFFIILAYLLAPKIESWVKRESMIVLCVLITIAIGISRIILNVHWLSDVVAGWSLGIFLSTSSILFVRYVSILLLKNSYQKASPEQSIQS